MKAIHHGEEGRNALLRSTAEWMASVQAGMLTHTFTNTHTLSVLGGAEEGRRGERKARGVCKGHECQICETDHIDKVNSISSGSKAAMSRVWVDRHQREPRLQHQLIAGAYD